MRVCNAWEPAAMELTLQAQQSGIWAILPRPDSRAIAVHRQGAAIEEEPP